MTGTAKGCKGRNTGSGCAAVRAHRASTGAAPAQHDSTSNFDVN